MPDYRKLTDDYIPTGLSVPYNVYKRADATTRERIRRNAVEQLAITMPPNVVHSITATVKKHPEMSPGVIEATAQAFKGLRYVSSNIMSLTNEALAGDLALSDAANLDVASQAQTQTFGATPDDPIPGVPQQTPPPPSEDPIPDPDSDSEGMLGWLEQRLPDPVAVAANALFQTAVPLVAPAVAAQELADNVGQVAGPSLLAPLGVVPPPAVPGLDKDSWLANKLADTVGSPSPNIPDPSVVDYVGPAVPRMLFGTVMNAMFAGIDTYNAQGRQYAGKYAKAYEVARRNGIEVSSKEQLEELFPDLSDGGEGALDRLYTLDAPGPLEPISDLRQSMLLAGVDDKSIPLGVYKQGESEEKARQQFDEYRQQVQANGGMLWNSTDLMRAIKEKNLAMTPWFGGEPNNRDGVLGKETYAGTVYDVRTWDEKQAIQKAAEARKMAMAAGGVEMSTEEYAKLTAPRPWTQGRGIAGSFVDPETFAYSVLSGVIDFGIALGADPMTYVPGAALTKPGKKAANLSAKALHIAEPFASDVFMTAAKKGQAQTIRETMDVLGVSDIPAKNLKWQKAKGVVAKQVDWADGGTGTLHPVSNGTKIKGVSVREVETRDFGGGVSMFRRGDGWAVQTSDGTRQFASNREARAFAKASGATGRGAKGQRWAVSDSSGATSLFDNPNDAKAAASLDPSLGTFETPALRKGADPLHYTVTRSGKRYDVRYNRQSKQWDIIDDGAKVSSHAKLREAESAINDISTKQAYDLVDPETGTVALRAVWQPDGTLAARGKKFDSLDEVLNAHLEPTQVTRERIVNSEVHRMINETKYGEDLVQALIDAGSPTAIHIRSGKKIPFAVAELISQAKTREEMARVVEATIGTAIDDPAAIKNFTGIQAKVYDATLNLGRSEGLKKAIYRWNSLAHNTNVIDMADPEDIADQMYRLAIEMGGSPDDAFRYIDEMTAFPTSVERREFFEDVMLPGLFVSRLKQMGVSKTRIAQFKSQFKFENDNARKRLAAFDDMVQRTIGEQGIREVNASGGRAAFDNPQWKPLLTEFGNEFTAYAVLTHGQHLVLPSARNLRKETNAFARAMRKITDDPTGVGDDGIDKVMSVMSNMLDHWRSLTLMNSAYILRNIAEEAIRAGFMGNANILTHPGHYLSLLSSVYSARAGAQKFNAFNRYARRMRKLANMADRVMYDPGMYKGTMLVKPEALIDLVDIRLANDDIVENAWGKRKRAATVGREIGKRGIIRPVEIVYDPATGRYGIGDGKKRVLLAMQHDAEVPVRIRPGALPGRQQVMESGTVAPANAPSTVTASGTIYTKTRDGRWVKVGGKKFENVAFVADDQANDIRNAMVSGRFTVDEDGRLFGLKFTGNPNEKKLRKLMSTDTSVSRDEAWRQAGGEVEEVWHKPRSSPSYGNMPVEWDDSGFNIGSKVKETRGRRTSIESSRFGPGGLMFHTSPKSNRDLIERTGLRPGRSGDVALSEIPYKLDDSTDVWIVDTRGFPLVPSGESQLLNEAIPRRRIRLATDEERRQLLDASGTGSNPLQPDIIDDAEDPVLRELAKIEAELQGAERDAGSLSDRIAAMGEVEPYGKPMPAGWQSQDITHDLLFGDSVTGDIHDVMGKAKRSVEEYLGWRRAMRYINPYYRASAARIVGEGQFDDLMKHAAFSDNAGMTNIGRQSVMIHGNNIADDNPDAMWIPGLRQVTYEDDPDAYVRLLAENIQDMLRLEENREFLAGRATVDDMVDRILADPERTQTVYAGMDAARLAAAKGRKVRPQFGDEITLNDIVRLQDLDENVVREELRNLIILSNAQATDFMGKGSSKKVSDAIASAVNDGGYEGKPIGPNNAAFRHLLQSELQNNPSFRESLPLMLDGVGHERYRKFGLTNIANTFFERAGNFRDLMTQHPLMREEYVDEVTRLMRWVSEKDKRKIIRNLIEWNDEPLARKLSRVPSAGDDGMLTMEMVERLADKYARRQAKAKFYDAAERRNWAVALRWAGPFLQVAANSTWAWGKAMATNTPDVYRTIRSINTLKDADLDPIYRLAGLDPVTSQQMGVNGVMYRDQYGEERFLLPALGAISTVVPFLPSVSATANTTSVDLFQDGLLGSSGPILQFVASMIFPDAQARDDMVGDIARKVQKYPLPQGKPWTKLAQSFMPVKWRNLMMDTNREADIANAVLASRMQHGDFGDPATWTEDDWQNNLAAVKRDVTWLITLEALGKLIVPTLGSWQYEPIGHVSGEMVEQSKGMTAGEVLTSLQAREYRKFTDGFEGEQLKARIAMFRELFGDYADLDTLGTKENNAVESVGPSTEYAYENRELYDSFKGLMAYMMPKGDYETQWNAKEQFLRRRNENIGWTERRTATEQLEYARQHMLESAYLAERKRAEEAGADGGDLTAILDKYRRAGYDTEFNAWTAETMSQMESMLFSSRGQEILDTVPSAKYVRKYFQYRAEVRKKLDDEFDSMSFESDQALEYDPGLTALFIAGETMAARDPGFARFWALAQREYGDDNMDAIRSRSAD